MSFILGLTGSIGMGKSTTVELLRQAGIPVHDADATVHALYRGAAVRPIEEAFPGTTADGVVDRVKLAGAVLGRPDALKQLEGLVHPLVRQAEQGFIARMRAAGQPLLVLDIPLLFETGGEARCDAVLVVTAPASVQRERVLSRPEMTPEKFDKILERQLPDAEKRRRGHFIVDTSQGLVSAQRALGSILTALAGRPGRRAETETDHA